jgi:large subunit ribosomal protein L30
MARLKITLVRSTANRLRNQRQTARSLGLTRMHKTVVHNDTPQIRGMITAIHHLVEVEEVADEAPQQQHGSA